MLSRRSLLKLAAVLVPAALVGRTASAEDVESVIFSCYSADKKRAFFYVLGVSDPKRRIEYLGEVDNFRLTCLMKLLETSRIPAPPPWWERDDYVYFQDTRENRELIAACE